MVIDTKIALKAAGVGIAGAVLTIIANGFRYLFQDVLTRALNFNLWNDISSIISFSTYTLGIAVAAIVGCGAVWILRGGFVSIRSAVIYAAIAGVVLGVAGSFAQVVYDLVFRPFIVGYAYSALDALITIAYCGVDVAVMAGLAIAGGTLYTVFVLNPDAIQVVSRVDVKQ
ncbi:MAG: hypothetical protein A4E28_01129 [Methanocella sp. PtaU1.Bin125]|nr:MAG: hypothetical protein A4E28_01129 [Methanocella sp. PtaU1.Bin125]